MSYANVPLFPLGKEEAPFRKLGDRGIRLEKAGSRELLVVDAEVLRGLAEQAFVDINHRLRPGHLAQLKKILDDPESTDNDRFVARTMLQNACVSAGMVLPSCQDTGTA